MKIDFSNNELNDIRHLLKCLDNQIYNIPLIKTFLEKLEQKLNPAPVTENRSRKKQTRKNLFHSMILNNIHGNSKVK